jgi:hypothetical protein
MESGTTFISIEDEGIVKKAMDILGVEGVPVQVVASIPEPVPDNVVVISSKTPPEPSRFPGSHIRIRPELRSVFVRDMQTKNPGGLSTAMLGMISVFDPDLSKAVALQRKERGLPMPALSA